MDKERCVQGLPRILIVDDLFGRSVRTGNEQRRNLCGSLRLLDCTRDQDPKTRLLEFDAPTAEAVFLRGQTPTQSDVGATVRNDLDEVLAAAAAGPRRGEPWSLVLLDLCFWQGRVTKESEQMRGAGVPGGLPGDDVPTSYFGLEILRALRERLPHLPVVILSAQDKDEFVKVRYNELGARGFVQRQEVTARGAHERLSRLIDTHGLLPDHRRAPVIVGESLPLLLALRAARDAARTQGHVLIIGETGVGKELFARFIHDSSERAEGPFRAQQLNTLTKSLIDSEIFGRTAVADSTRTARPGLFREADRGTLFLDEIATIDGEIQEKLLRVLDTGDVRPLGATQSVKVDVRVVSATNEDIHELAGPTGGFRADLLMRLRRAGAIVVPPLRARGDDIELLSRCFLKAAVERYGAQERDLHSSALDVLRAHTWPGNVRELRDCIEAAVASHRDNDLLVSAHLRLALDRRSAAVVTPIAPRGIEAMRRVGGLRGRLGDVLATLFDYVEEALDATRDRRNGRVVITTAHRLILGTDQGSAGRNDTQRAAAFLKRLAKLEPSVAQHLSERKTILEALSEAEGVRPSSGRKR